MSTPSLTSRQRSAADELRALLARRIAILEGPKGTMVQARNLGESDFRGTCFCGHSHDLKGDNDILNLTQPRVVQDIHEAYIDAGADIVSTNTFNGTRISQADYATESAVADLNRSAAALCVRAAEAGQAKYGRRIFVAGAIGPTNRTLSLSPDVNRPDFRAVTFEQVVAAYYEQARSLVEGGAELLLVETIFDTLNAKAAIFAIHQLFDEIGTELPLSISVTITDASGRTLSGQTVGAFYHSIRHAKPFSVGINCALGGAQMRPYIEELASVAECYVSCYPNAGLPNAFGGYDEKPEDMGRVLADFAENGWLNIVGGCCGSTPAHIAAIAAAVRAHAPRPVAAPRQELRLSGLEALVVS